MTVSLLLALTGHGYGHAAQAAPVVDALRRLRPNLRVHVRSRLPLDLLKQFFGSIDGFSCPLGGDFGAAMASPLDIDAIETAERYAAFHADYPRLVAREAAAIADLGIDLVVANISYLTLAGAKAAGIPAYGLGSFSWLEIYRYYCHEQPDAMAVARQICDSYQAADGFLALTPYLAMPHWPVYPVGPVARLGRCQPEPLATLFPERKKVLISMGGVEGRLDLAAWPEQAGIAFIVAGQTAPERADMASLATTGLSHIDCLASVDALITKPGYASVVEAACHGIPTLYVRRGGWPEEESLLTWLHGHCAAHPISRADLEAGRTAEMLTVLWRQAPLQPPRPTGGEEAARYLAGRLPVR